MAIEPFAIDNVLLSVPDVAAAARWYESTVGLSIAVMTADIAVLHTIHSGPGIVLRKGAGDQGHSTFWIEVADAKAVADDLGLTPFPVATGLCVEICDPWGNTIGFTDYSTRPELSNVARARDEP